jgi:hypothetical protein
MSKEWLHEQLQHEREEYYDGSFRWPILEFSDDALRAIRHKRHGRAHTVR